MSKAKSVSKKSRRTRFRHADHVIWYARKPFNAQHTTLYTVVDMEDNIRGTENLVFPMGAETRKQCREMLRRLEGYDSTVGEIKSEVSYRNRIPLRVVKVFRE